MLTIYSVSTANFGKELVNHLIIFYHDQFYSCFFGLRRGCNNRYPTLHHLLQYDFSIKISQKIQKLTIT